MKPPLLIAVDFDGTVTRQDTLVEILNRFGHSDWTQVQNQVVRGEISIREGLEREMGSIQATPEALRRLLADRIEVEPSFSKFLKAMRAQGVPVILLSGGFDLCLETVMTQAGLWPVPYLANRIHYANGAWKVEFPYPSTSCSACGHCKADPIRTWNSQGYTTIFVGNGVTDRCPSEVASLTFAKDELSHWCKTQGISVVSYETFDDIEKELVRRGWL